VIPAREDVGGDRPQVLQETSLGPARSDGAFPGEDGEIGTGVEGEGEQIEGHEQAGEGQLE
jgi:hypothetical protein